MSNRFRKRLEDGDDMCLAAKASELVPLQTVQREINQRESEERPAGASEADLHLSFVSVHEKVRRFSLEFGWREIRKGRGLFNQSPVATLHSESENSQEEVLPACGD